LNPNWKTGATQALVLWVAGVTGTVVTPSAAAESLTLSPPTLTATAASAVGCTPPASCDEASFARRAQAASAPQPQKPVTQIPEPSTTVLMLLGLAGIAWARARHTGRQP
jgi:PEP-CTERM motif